MKRDIVLFRNKDGEVAALKDQCPHKGLPLSQGHMKDGKVVCGYHGWQFDVSGACVKAPCLNPNETCPEVSVDQYTIKEQDGWVWLFWGNDEKVLAEGPPRHHREKNYKFFDLERQIEAQPHFILENSFDCSHACFVHESRLREGPTQLATAELTETEYGLHVATREKRGRKIKIARYLPWKIGEVYHTDEYFKPFTACVNYHFGMAKHRIILTCCPEDENITRVYTRTGISVGPLSGIAASILKIMTPWVVQEDIDAIEGQARSYANEGGRYGPMKDADVPAIWMFRLYRRFFENRESDDYKTKQVSYRL